MALSPHEILKQHFERKKITHPSYSLRRMARDIKISPSFLSAVLSGKKKIPLSRLRKLVKVLGMDEVSCLQLKRALEYPNKKSKNPDEITQEDKNFLKKYYTIPNTSSYFLKHWYRVALLDLTKIEGFKNDTGWIAEKLGISNIEVALTIDVLLELKLLKYNQGRLEKTHKKINFPTKQTSLIVREFHQQMIHKAHKELEKSDSKSFNKRLITGATVLISAEKIEKIKEDLNQYLYELVDDLSDSLNEELYQINFQFFPLTKS